NGYCKNHEKRAKNRAITDTRTERSIKRKPSEKVLIHDGHPDQTITIEGNLTAECRSRLIKILRKHADAFAWTPVHMTGIPRFITEHELKTYHHIEPRVQRKRSIASDRKKVVKDEVAEWLKAKIVRKDLYPLPEIDWKTESLIGFKYKCFLDAYKGYHQIQMAKKDEEKTTFHTNEGVFCYTKMPFGLNNARATYQRLVDTIFEGKIRRNLEAYVDDMVIKSKTELEMIKDVKKTPLTLTKAMKKLIMQLPTLTTLKEEELMVYISAANEAVNVVLLVERDGRQTSIHYVSRTLQGVEINYPPMEKLALALVHTARRLRRYNDRGQPYTSENRWSDDTLAEGESMEEQEDTKNKAPKNLRAETDIWKLYTNGASNEHGSGAGLILIDPEGAEYSYALRLNFINSNNNAEYKALLMGLRIATKINVNKMHASVDSKLVANQVEGSYEAKGEKTKKYKEKALEMI
nr:hypothetical protein [Tanacetum cinerariifolium]